MKLLLAAALSLFVSAANAATTVQPSANPGTAFSPATGYTWSGAQTFSSPSNVYYGDGSNLTGVAGSAATQAQFNAIAVSTNSEAALRAAADAALAASTTTLQANITSEAASRLAGDAGITTYSRVLTVAPSGAQYTTVGAALTALGTPTAPTLISVMPGIYTESPFVVPSSVTIAGLGGQAELRFTAVPAVTISAGNTSTTLRRIFINVTNFSGAALRIEGSGLGGDVLPTNAVVITESGLLGSPAIQHVGTRRATILGTSVIGIVNALVTTSTSSVFAVNSAFTSVAANGDAVSLGGNNQILTFMGCFFSPNGTGKAINSSVAVTPSIVGSHSDKGSASVGSLVSASTATVFLGGLSINGSTFSYTLPAGGGLGYDHTNIPTSPSLVVTSTGMALYSGNGDGAISLQGSLIAAHGYNGNAPGHTGYCYGGTPSAPTACPAGSFLNFIGAKGYDGTNSVNSVGSNAAIALRQFETASTTGKGSNVTIETTLSGTTTRRQRVDVKDTGRVAIAPRANTITPLGLLHLAGTDNGISITGNGVSLYATEAIVSLSTVTSTGFFGPVTGDVTGNVSGNAGTATSLAANGGNCSAGSFPLGVDASGAAESCSTSISGNAATVTTNANLTGPVTSVGNATTIVGPIPATAVDLSTVTTAIGNKLDKTGTDALSITGASGYITTQSSITGSAFFGNGSGLTSVMRSSCTSVPNTVFTNTTFGIAVATVTLTTRGNPVRVDLNAVASNSTANIDMFSTLYIDGNWPSEFAGTPRNLGAGVAAQGGDKVSLGYTFTAEGLSAGSHTFAVAFRTTANTGTVHNAASDSYAQFCVRESP